MSDRAQTLCPTCGEAIEPEERNVVEAVEIRAAPGFGAPGDAVEGMNAMSTSRASPRATRTTDASERRGTRDDEYESGDRAEAGVL
jgi:hypothetical protein